MMRRRVTFAEKIFFTLSDPHYCTFSFFACGFILALIAASAFVQVLESMEGFKQPPCTGCAPVVNAPRLQILDSCSMVIFTIEFVLRLCTVGYVDSLNQYKVKDNGQLLLEFQVNNAPVCDLLEKVKKRAFTSKLRSFLLCPYTITDILALVPYYIAKILDLVSRLQV
jgi:hypothetical protein